MLHIKKIWNKIIQETWNIAIAEISNDFSPVNIKWMKHDYSDRWFADPFLLQETPNTYVILAEEYMRNIQLGRICKLIVEKEQCRLIHNETILDLETHLSFPNVYNSGTNTFVYPENSASGQLTIYRLTKHGLEHHITFSTPLIDPVLFQAEDKGLFILGTLPEDANGNVLHIYKFNNLHNSLEEIQKIEFRDNIARRAGNIFKWEGDFVAPAQVCNKHYGEGISFQKIHFSEKGSIIMSEIKRLKAKQITKMTGFHTYNTFGKKVIIDGYSYGNEFIHDIYFDIRGLKNM